MKNVRQYFGKKYFKCGKNSLLRFEPSKKKNLSVKGRYLQLYYLRSQTYRTHHLHSVFYLWNNPLLHLKLIKSGGEMHNKGILVRWENLNTRLFKVWNSKFIWVSPIILCVWLVLVYWLRLQELKWGCCRED